MGKYCKIVVNSLAYESILTLKVADMIGWYCILQSQLVLYDFESPRVWKFNLTRWGGFKNECIFCKLQCLSLCLSVVTDPSTLVTMLNLYALIDLKTVVEILWFVTKCMATWDVSFCGLPVFANCFNWLAWWQVAWARLYHCACLCCCVL